MKMKPSITIFLFSLYRLLYAQDAPKPFNRLNLLGTQLTCNNGNPPSVTCNENLVDNICSCSCTNGIVYKQLHPSLWANSTASSLCPQYSQCSQCPPTTFLPQHPTKLPTKPCLDVELQGWTWMELPHKAHSLDPSELVTKHADISEDSIMVVADSAKRCQHYEVYIDGELIGETSGDGLLDDSECGTPENCIENHGGSHGHFVLPKGQHIIGIRWVKVTDACKKYDKGVGSFKIYKQCQKDQQGSSAQLRECEARSLEEQRQSSAQLLECQEQNIQNQQDNAAQLSNCQAENLQSQQEAALQLTLCNEQARQERDQALQEKVQSDQCRTDLAIRTQERDQCGSKCKQEEIKNQQEHAAQLNSCKADRLKDQQQNSAQLQDCQAKQLNNQQQAAEQLNQCKVEQLNNQQQYTLQIDQLKAQHLEDNQKWTSQLDQCKAQQIENEKNYAAELEKLKKPATTTDLVRCPEHDGKEVSVGGKNFQNWCGKYHTCTTHLGDTQNISEIRDCMALCAARNDCNQALVFQPGKICRLYGGKHGFGGPPSIVNPNWSGGIKG